MTVKVAMIAIGADTGGNSKEIQRSHAGDVASHSGRVVLRLNLSVGTVNAHTAVISTGAHIAPFNLFPDRLK